MQNITRSYPSFPFKPLHGESTDHAELAARGSFFSATLDDAVCYAEPIPAPLLPQAEHEARIVTWFRSLQTLPPHGNVLPYQDRLVACPSVDGDAAGQTYFLVSSGAAAAMTANGLLVGQLLSLPAYLDELKEKLGSETLTLPENAIRTIAMDVLCALHHLHLHGLVHRHVCPSAVRVNTASVAARLGDLACSIDSFSGSAALTLRDADVVSDVRGLGHIVLALMAADANFAVPPPEASASALKSIIAAAVGSEKKYSQELLDFALACLTAGPTKADLEALFQQRFLLPIVVADVHRSRVPATAQPPHQAQQPQPQQLSLLRDDQSRAEESSLPVPLAANQLGAERHGSTSHMSLDHSGIATPVLTQALPRTTAGIGSPFKPGSLNSRTRFVPTRRSAGDVYVMHSGTTLPKREQYYYMEGGQRRYLAGYGLLFELEVQRAITLEDIFFATVGDVRSMHVQLYWKAGDVLKNADSLELAKKEWVPVLRRPKHLRKVMAHKPQSVGPFSLRLPFVDSLASASHNKHSFLLISNYAHGIRFYGLPHGLMGQPVGAPLDTDGVVTISTGVPCGAEVCTAAATAAGHTLQPQAKPDTADGDESTDEDEVQDPRTPSSNEAKNDDFQEAGIRASVSAALDKALGAELAKPHDCPRGLFGGLKYTLCL